MLPTRVKLHEQLPLKTPFSVHIFPTYKCNFKCNYCIQALSLEAMKKKGFSKDVMSYETYKNAIDGISEYKDKLKALIFAGHGEPLLHPDIARMVAYAKVKDVAQRVEITTNASLLTKSMGDNLIKAGVDRLKISIQGVTADKYKEVAKYNIKYEKFLENLKYFFEHKKHTEVYIKIIDIALNNEEQKELFIKMFKPVATYVDIEYAIPFVNEIDHKKLKTDFDRCKQGNLGTSHICSMPFYMQVVAPNGDVLPCCATDIPIILGNVNTTSIKKIWNSKKHNEFLKLMLKDKNLNSICKLCSVPAFGLQEGDYLDDYKDKLITKYERI